MTKLEQQKWNEAMEKTGIADTIRNRATQNAIIIFSDFLQNRTPEWISKKRGIELEIVKRVIDGVAELKV